MAWNAKKTVIDPEEFLATVDGGRTKLTYSKDAAIFSQATPPTLNIQKGRIKIAVTSEQGREAVVAILGDTHNAS
jgi:CRP/FNR family transcriptional regulator, cyclic AMP receptor protein